MEDNVQQDHEKTEDKEESIQVMEIVEKHENIPILKQPDNDWDKAYLHYVLITPYIES